MQQKAIANPDHTIFPRAGFFRRFGAIIYDTLVIAAVLMLAAGIALAFVAILNATGIIQLSEGQDHASILERNWLYRIYLVAVTFWFYTWFWVRGGQTIGMRAWRLKVQNTNGACINYKQAAIRFITALFGLGNLMVPVSRQKLSLQDKAAGCEVIILSPEANKLRNWRRFS